MVVWLVHKVDMRRLKKMKELIRTENLSKRYGDVLTVKSINLSVMEDTIYGFCGPNGA